MRAFTILKSAVFLFFIFSYNQLFAQTNLHDAWKAFFENNRASARSLFTQASSQPESKSEALLGLSLLAQMDRPATESFDFFKKFYQQSQNPQPYIYALWTTPSINETFAKKSADQLTFLRALTQQKDYDGAIAAMAYSMIGNHYQSSKNIALTKEFANIGSVDNWAITGDFQNISTSGFDKSYETLSHPENNATFKNKNGISFAWHTVPYIRHDKWFDFQYYANADDAIFFAQSFIKSDAEQEAQLRIGVSGSVKVWVNDQLILSEAEERNNDLDSYIQSIKLHSGNNRILVQIGESYAGRSNFLLRLTDQNGHPLSNITSSAKFQPYTKENNYVSKKTEQFAIAYFEQQISKNPEDYLSQLLLAQAYLSMDKSFEARKIIEPLSKKYPNSTYLNSMLLTLFNKTNNRTGQETIKETIKMADPESSTALTFKYNELIEQKDYTKAAEVVDKIKELYPFREEFILSARLNLANDNNNQNDLIKFIDEAYSKYPDNKPFVEDKYYVEFNLKKNATSGIEVLKKFIATNDDYPLTKDLANAYFNIGKPADGFKTYLDEIAFDPIAVNAYSELGQQYYKQQMYAKAEESFLSCINIAPTVGWYYDWLAKIHEATTQKEKAIQFYKKGIELDPTDYTSARALRKLEGKNEVFTYFKQPDIAGIIKNAPKAADYPDDNFAVLDQEEQRVVYENGGSEDKRYFLIKIFNQKGIDAFKEYNIDYDNDQNYNVEVAEVIKANGNRVPAEKNRSNLVFTNLEIGDVINIRYRTENNYKGTLANHFWDSFYFTKGCPSVNLNYSLLINKNKPFTYKFSGQKIEPEKKSVDEFDLYTWKANNIKSINIEDKMPAMGDVANVLYLTSIPNWKYISNWYNDLASAKARTNYEVKAVVNDLFNGGNFNELQKVEKIYNYITSNISYSSVAFRQSGIIPQNPADVINTKIGDCKDVATLFVTMCKEAGIKAQLVLVKTREYGLNSMVLPSIDFNHCMAKVNLNNQDYYIELTSKYLPFGSMYSQYINSSILDIGGIDNSTIKYLNPSSRKQNIINRTSTISFKDKDLLIDESAYETAAVAGAIKSFYKDLSLKDQIKKTKEAISQAYPDNEINQIAFKDAIDTVYFKINYEIRNTIKEIAGLSIFSLPWSNKFTPAIFQIALPRTNGVDISQLFAMDSESEAFVITLPPGKALIETPAPVSLTSDVIDYSIVPTISANKLTLTRTIKFKKDFIAADKVPEFNSFYKKIVESDNKEFAIK